jgi:hypothetical protein
VSSLHYQLSRFIQKDLSRPRQLYMPLVAQEEYNAQVRLQLLDLPAQRWLGNVQLLRGLAEIEVFRDGEKVTDVTQFHGPVFYTC